MEKIKKALKRKFISIIVSIFMITIIFFNSNIAYPLPYIEQTLRLQPGQKDDTLRRMIEVILPPRAITTADSNEARNPLLFSRRGFFLTAASLLTTSCSIPEYVERANRLYDRAKAEPDYMEKIRLLEALVSDNSNINLALFRPAVWDLFTLLYRFNSRRALEIYLRYYELGFKPEGAFSIWSEGFKSDTIVDLYELLGEFDKAEQSLLDLLRPGSNLSDEGVKEVKEALKKVYYLKGDYNKALSLGDNPYLRQVKEKLDRMRKTYPPLDGKIGDMSHFSKNPKTPLYVFINPDNLFPFTGYLFDGSGKVLGEAIKRRDRSVFIDLFKDINIAFSCLSSGSFGLDLRKVSFDKIRPLVPLPLGLSTGENRSIAVLTSSDIAPLLGKGLIVIIGYEIPGERPFMLEYRGRGVVLVDRAGMSIKGFKLNLIHEILHGLGMFHPTIPTEILIMRARRGHVFPEGYFDSIESAKEDERHHLTLSEPTRIKLGWPKIRRIPLNMPTLQEDIEKVLPKRLPRRSIILPISASI